MPAARRVVRDDLQLDLFDFNALRFPEDETTNPIRPDGRETLASTPTCDGRGIGGKGAAPPDVARSGGPDRGGVGFAPPSLHQELYAWEFDGPFLRDFTGRKPAGARRNAGAIENPG